MCSKFAFEYSLNNHNKRGLKTDCFECFTLLSVNQTKYRKCYTICKSFVTNKILIFQIKTP